MIAVSQSQPLQSRGDIPFAELEVGIPATVVSLTGKDHDLGKLTEMGLRRGARLKLIRRGKTAIVKVDAQYLCLRMPVEFKIMVCPDYQGNS